jgi:hypothetical protein
MGKVLWDGNVPFVYADQVGLQPVAIGLQVRTRPVGTQSKAASNQSAPSSCSGDRPPARLPMQPPRSKRDCEHAGAEYDSLLATSSQNQRRKQQDPRYRKKFFLRHLHHKHRDLVDVDAFLLQEGAHYFTGDTVRELATRWRVPLDVLRSERLFCIWEVASEFMASETATASSQCFPSASSQPAASSPRAVSPLGQRAASTRWKPPSASQTRAARAERDVPRGGFKRTREDAPPPPTHDARTDRERSMEMLGLDLDATSVMIRKAFLRASLLAHPDKGGDVESFIKLKMAYDTLSEA